MTKRAVVSESELLRQLAAANARARRALARRPHATAARYDPSSECLVVCLSNGATLSIPASIVPPLRTASARDVSEVKIDRSGLVLHWPTLDADVSVSALARYALGGKTLLSAAGAAGGAVRSVAKQNAARRNGRLGGRPKVS